MTSQQQATAVFLRVSLDIPRNMPSPYGRVGGRRRIIGKPGFRR
jgi:hypothetical protein